MVLGLLGAHFAILRLRFVLQYAVFGHWQKRFEHEWYQFLCEFHRVGTLEKNRCTLSVAVFAHHCLPDV